MKIERIWAMPNHETFKIKPIAEMMAEEFNNESFIDPFPFPFKEDALEYLKSIKSNSIKYVAFDPPYSQRQLREMYNNAGLSLDIMNNGYWAKCKTEIARIIKSGGKCISFGWNSGGIGKKNNFEITRILLINHGSMHNDTICTVDKKL